LVWVVTNVMSIVYFSHAQIWGQFGLQFILIALSVKGWMDWANDDKQLETRGINRVEAVS
jgi:nicotinamide riboside transporter PnuC